MTATLLFIGVFAYLASVFDYPAILDQPAAVVLPRLLALGPTGRAVWILYGLVPLLLVPTALCVRVATQQDSPRAGDVAVVMAMLGAACMAAGLLRWPSLHWHLALAYSADTAAHASIAAAFGAANSYLGVFVGEFLGELFLNGFFLAATLALAGADGLPRRWLRYAGMVAVVFGGIAMFRNATSVVAPFAAINNGVLPIWMFTLGAAIATHRRPSAAQRSAAVTVS